MSRLCLSRSRIFAAVALAAWAASGTARLSADPLAKLRIHHADVTLGPACSFGTPIATLGTRVHNEGDEPSAPQVLAILDASNLLSGSATVPSIAPHKSEHVDVPLNIVSIVGLAGKQHLSGYLGLSAIPTAGETPAVKAEVEIPASFCATVATPAAPTPPPAIAPPNTSGTLQGSATLRSPSVLAFPTITPDPRLSHSFQQVLTPPPTPQPFHVQPISAIGALVLPKPPLNARPALSATACITHLGPFNCAAVIAGGNLILMWDQPANQVGTGYRVYGVDASGNGPTLIASVANFNQTEVEMPSAGGYVGHCYAVSTFNNSGESARGNVYCATLDSYAKTKFLFPTQQLSTPASNGYNAEISGDFLGGDPLAGRLVAGYFYQDEKQFQGDDALNYYHRLAVKFDVTPYLKHRLLFATLQLTIQDSRGMGNNFSCANNMGTGTEFWWERNASAMIQGTFDPLAWMPTTGPQINTNVTAIVIPWLAGAPNYGFVARNTDENLNAFTNKQCETAYTNPVLEIVYY